MEDDSTNYFAYNLSQLYKDDLHAVIPITGKTRSGKSTLLMELTAKIWAFRLLKPYKIIWEYMIKAVIANDYFYNDKQDSIMNIKNSRERVYGYDESYWVGDTRKSMDRQQVFLTEVMNSFANKNHVYFMLIQKLKDLDKRFISLSTAVIYILERGEAMLFEPAIDSTITDAGYGFDRFQKEPYLLANKIRAGYNLRKLPSYVSRINFYNLKTSENELERKAWDFYLNNKERWQEKVQQKQKFIYTITKTTTE